MTITLADTALFGGFTPEALQALEAGSQVRHYKRNTMVISMDEPSLAAFVLLDGSAQAFAEDDKGNEFIINVFKPGDCFGELGVIDGRPRTANVMITSPSQLLVIPAETLESVLRMDPQSAWRVMQHLVGRIREMTEEVSALAMMSVYGRITRLLHLSATDTNGLRTTERLTHQDIANRIGSSREMVSKILKDLQIGGYITVHDHRITLKKSLPERW